MKLGRWGTSSAQDQKTRTVSTFLLNPGGLPWLIERGEEEDEEEEEEEEEEELQITGPLSWGRFWSLGVKPWKPLSQRLCVPTEGKIMQINPNERQPDSKLMQISAE